MLVYNFHNGVRNFGPSLVSNLTPEELDDLVANSKGHTLQGEIPSEGIVTITPDAIKLAPGNNATLTMKIILPKTIPDEIVGKELLFSASFKYSPQETGIAAQDELLHLKVLE